MKIRFFLIAALIGFAVVLGGLAATAPPLQSLIQHSKTRADIVEKAQRAVVHIEVEKTVPAMRRGGNRVPFDSMPDEFKKFFFPDTAPQSRSYPFGSQAPREFRQFGQGSGTIVSQEGHVLTSSHVVSNSSKIAVTLSDGREFSAEIVGADPQSDIAVIKIDGEDLPVMPMGNSDEIRIGETVIAIGNPYRLSNTVTMGIVSAKGRSNVGLIDYENFIQTDAAINPGNSGGPLIDLEGKIIGVNAAIFSRSGGYQGIGFSVPINMARHIMEALISDGQVKRGWLGVNIQDFTPQLAQAFGVENQQGALVAKVLENSPASQAGLKQGDIIVNFNQHPVADSNDLQNKVGLAAPQTMAALKVIRNGAEIDINLKLGERSSPGITSPEPVEKVNSLGISVQDLNPELADKFGYQTDSGVVVTEVAPDSVAFQAGLRAGNMIQEINQEKIEDAQSFQEAIEKADPEEGILLLVTTPDGSRYLVLKSA